MPPSPESRRGGARGSVVAALGIAWITAVLGAYYYYNAGYYVEKIGTFSAFVIRLLS